MKKNIVPAIMLLLICLLLFYLVFLFAGDMIEALLPKVEGAAFQAGSVQDPFYSVFKFSIAIALVPALCWLTWKITPVTTNKARIVSFAIILGGIFIAIMTRRVMIRSDLENMALLNKGAYPKYGVSMPMTHLHFDYYLLGGALLGCIISYFIYRNKKTP